MTATEPPNHHANYPGFAGFSGLIAGLSMTAGRGDVARLAADLAEVTASDRVVDVGCGPGTAAREAARRGAQVWGIDPAPVMLRLARLASMGRGRITWLEGVAEALPLANGVATVLGTISSVHHWPDLTGALTEAHRVLVPGGRLLAIERKRAPGTTGMASHGWTEAQGEAFAAMCRSAGFVEVRAETARIGGGQVVVMGRRP